MEFTGSIRYFSTMATALKKHPTFGGPRAQPGVKNPRAKIVVRGNTGIKIVRAVTINKPAAELYAFWRDVSNLAQLINHPVTITPKSDDESHWSISVPDGRLEWDALVINDEPGKLIAWRSRENSDIANAGTVRFEQSPGDEETAVTVALEYNPPAGKLGATDAKEPMQINLNIIGRRRSWRDGSHSECLTSEI